MWPRTPDVLLKKILKIITWYWPISVLSEFNPSSSQSIHSFVNPKLNQNLNVKQCAVFRSSMCAQSACTHFAILHEEDTERDQRAEVEDINTVFHSHLK